MVNVVQDQVGNKDLVTLMPVSVIRLGANGPLGQLVLKLAEEESTPENEPVTTFPPEDDHAQEMDGNKPLVTNKLAEFPETGVNGVNGPLVVSLVDTVLE